MHDIKWLDAPEDHDYPAAQDFLELHLTPEQAEQGVTQLRDAKITHKKAKDILRATGLAILPKDDPHVAKDLEKIHDGKALSPVLLFRAYPTILADGYHRVCACYHVEPDTEVPCQIV